MPKSEFNNQDLLSTASSLMNVNLKALIIACEQNNIRYESLHYDGNLILVHTGRVPSLFANWTTPVNSHAISRLCNDKHYTYAALSPHMRMAKTLSFLDPDIDATYSQYLKFNSYESISDEIETQIGYPVILKKNRGWNGMNIFLVNQRTELLKKLAIMYNKKTQHYDYMVLAQETIDIRNEYRVIFYSGQLIFAYLKDNKNATYSGNLSPLHWEGAKAVKVSEPDLLTRLEYFAAPGLNALGIQYAGIDIAQAHDGTLWAIELNAAPAFDIYTRDCGSEDIVHLFTLMLRDLSEVISPELF